MSKYFMFIVFTLLPKVIIKAYVELSFFIYITKLRDKLTSEQDIDVDMVNRLLTLTYNKTAIQLPYRTYNWVWNEELVNDTIVINNNQCRLGNVICDYETTVLHNHAIIEHFIKKLPKIVKLKLFGKDRKTVTIDTLSFKHALTRVLINGLV